MNAINSVIVEGNVVKAPEFKQTNSGHRVCTIPIAVNHMYKSNSGEKVEEVSFFNIETWGNLADSCSKYCPKGRGVRVVGRLKQSRWKDTDGKSKSRISIIAEHVEFKPYFKKIDVNPQRNENIEKENLAEAALAAEQEQEEGVEVAF